MALGATFKEALQKALRSLEIDRFGLQSLHGLDGQFLAGPQDQNLVADITSSLQTPTADRLWHIADGFRAGLSLDDLHTITSIDPWFLEQIRQLVEFENTLATMGTPQDSHSSSVSQEAVESHGLSQDLLRQAKQLGFSDKRIAQLLSRDLSNGQPRDSTLISHHTVTYKRVDTCAAEFEAQTPYLYSTYGLECEARPTDRQKVVILGGGPNRIGQGIEFDYCCVHAAMALREVGIESIMVNCNPETVSTDYDISDRLYFEPLTKEDVYHIVETERPLGVVVQFGGQTPLKLTLPLEKEGVPILGTSPDSIDRAEDRKRFSELLNELGLWQTRNGSAQSLHEAHQIAANVGYPIMVRPSYVLGGRAMQIIYDSDSLDRYMQTTLVDSTQFPLLIDHYLEDAIEVDVDAIADRQDVVVAGIMEHVEMAGIHSGDSACSLPPHSLSQILIDEISRQTVALAKALGVVGLMNIQFAVQHDRVYVLEVNPRASRTVPFVSKSIGVPLAKLAMKVMVGKTLQELNFTQSPAFKHMSVKEAVFPFTKLGAVDILLGPEMRSTGEVMGIDKDFGWAFAKSQAAAGLALPAQGNVLLTVKDADKKATISLAQRLSHVGFSLHATRGTATFLEEQGLKVEPVNKVKEGRPHIVDFIKNREFCMVVNTVGSSSSQEDSAPIRKEALYQNIPYFTTIQGAMAGVMGIEAMIRESLTVRSLQEYQRGSRG